MGGLGLGREPDEEWEKKVLKAEAAPNSIDFRVSDIGTQGCAGLGKSIDSNSMLEAERRRSPFGSETMLPTAIASLLILWIEMIVVNLLGRRLNRTGLVCGPLAVLLMLSLPDFELASDDPGRISIQTAFFSLHFLEFVFSSLFSRVSDHCRLSSDIIAAIIAAVQAHLLRPSTPAPSKLTTATPSNVHFHHFHHFHFHLLPPSLFDYSVSSCRLIILPSIPHSLRQPPPPSASPRSDCCTSILLCSPLGTQDSDHPLELGGDLCFGFQI
ncbi:hypothetical protein BDW69DRAFT_72595 [Aspergillus filifer]